MQHVIYGVIFLVGLALGAVGMALIPTSEETTEWRLGAESGYTNPLLECEIGADGIASQKIDFTSELRSFVENITRSAQVEDLSVYYRDLNNGPTTGAGQEEQFAPASLLKVPVLIAYLKWSEEDPNVLEEQIPYRLPFDFGYVPQFSPEEELILGETYTARELLERMVVYSDNQALGLLYQRMPSTYQEDLFRLLGVNPDLITDPTEVLTVRHYSIFFRILFNASFLSRDNSEYALGLLARSSFNEGLKAGVPNNVEVAHKFGERRADSGLQQFHDCGIVYYPDHPYLLCIMTRGTNSQALIDAIQQTSRFVYGKINDQYKK